jgi:hypothetical protein
MLTRRDWLRMTTLSAAAWLRAPADSARETRIRRVIEAYESQGIHRTATDVDRASAEWLSQEVRATGLAPALESFLIQRVDLIETSIIVNGRRIEGVPFFDGGFTDAEGVRGRLGPLGGGTEIGFTVVAPTVGVAGVLGEARRTMRHRAIVCVTRGGRPGLSLNNAESFLDPFGPPVLQVSSEENRFLDDCVSRQSEAQIVAHVKRTPAQALNVTATIGGANRNEPLIVMTPRSGWWTCGSERGGGLACWLELMRELRANRAPRDIVFVASSGHELGFLGIKAFIEQRPGIAARSAGWIHFGANIGAAQDPGNTLQASDDRLETLEAEAMTAAGLGIDRRIPRGAAPGGEAGEVHRGGGRYVSIIGRNALFHNPADRGPEAVDINAISRFADAFTTIAKALAA